MLDTDRTVRSILGGGQVLLEADRGMGSETCLRAATSVCRRASDSTFVSQLFDCPVVWTRLCGELVEVRLFADLDRFENLF